MNASTTFANWSRASVELNFVFVSPFALESADSTHTCFAYLPEFGSPKGLVVVLDYDEQVFHACKALEYSYSCLFRSDDPYDLQDMKDVLNDWGWACKSKAALPWYTGAPWTA